MKREHFTSAGVKTRWHVLKYDETRPGFWNGGDLSSTEGHWGSSQHDHDLNGNRVRDIWTLRGVAYTLSQTRDDRDYLIAKSYSDGDAVGSPASPWAYDAAGRLTAIPGHVTSFEYTS